jgi:hypothetical protein
VLGDKWNAPVNVAGISTGNATLRWRSDTDHRREASSPCPSLYFRKEQNKRQHIKCAFEKYQAQAASSININMFLIKKKLNKPSGRSNA